MLILLLENSVYVNTMQTIVYMSQLELGSTSS